jgi:hypothetical protein
LLSEADWMAVARIFHAIHQRHAELVDTNMRRDHTSPETNPSAAANRGSVRDRDVADGNGR